MVDMRKDSGPILTTIFSFALITTFLANLICYMLVWAKIKQVCVVSVCFFSFFTSYLTAKSILGVVIVNASMNLFVIFLFCGKCRWGREENKREWNIY